MAHLNGKIFSGVKLFCLVLVIQQPVTAQCLTSQNIWDSLNRFDADAAFTSERLSVLYNLQKKSDACGLPRDSVYARLLNKIGAFEFKVNHDYNSAVQYALRALELNQHAVRGSSVFVTKRIYFSLAYYYDSLYLTDKALAYYDSVIFLTEKFPDNTKNIVNCRVRKSYIYFRTGDYQQAVEESTMGAQHALQKGDTSSYIGLLNQRCQSLFFQDKLRQSLADAEIVINIAERLHNDFELASALKIKGLIREQQRDFPAAKSLFQQAIKTRLRTKDFVQVARDYNDLGNLYFDSLGDPGYAKACYLKTIEYSEKNDILTLAGAHLNLGKVYQRQLRFTEARQNYTYAMQDLKLHPGSNFYLNPSNSELKASGNNWIIFEILESKVGLLLDMYHATKDPDIVRACLQTAMLTDSMITQMRYEQAAEQSKLYWRNKTRGFFTNALEACYLENNAKLCFYFMEKSRAVLLNDKLNELGAAAYLPPAETVKQQHLQNKIVELERKLSTLSDTLRQFQDVQLQLLVAKDNLDHYIKSLEQAYPVYYQYKYAEQALSLDSLQGYLAKKNQSFVYYFINDAAAYILAVTPQAAKITRLSDHFGTLLTDFLQLCSDKQQLNDSYSLFAAKSSSLYKLLFQPLKLPEGHVVICQDNVVIPFEALCDDTHGKHFLLNRYSFSYVYSASFLMKRFSPATAKGDFTGFAPVSFASYLNVPDLKKAADALSTCSEFYKTDKLFIDRNATRRNFFTYASSYSVVSVFSHAMADTGHTEPMLFMQDSVIYLSELQLLRSSAAELVLLSACETNAGKNAVGEGVYSLARGFATAGIPSVVGTLWTADEQSIYAISEKFNEYLAQGINKDDALRKAKLYFIQNNSSEKTMPYYWANAILIGDAKAITLTASNSNSFWWIAAAAVLILGTIVIFARKKLNGSF